MIYSISSVFVSSSTVARAAIDERMVKKGLEHICMCVSVYVYRVHICRREAKLLLSEYIEPQCLYRSRQASNVYTHAEL